MRTKSFWVLMLTGVSGLFAPQCAAADAPSIRVAQLNQSLASIEREEAVVAQSDNGGAKALLAEVHRNIALTIAGIRNDDRTASATSPAIAAAQEYAVQARTAPADKTDRDQRERRMEITVRQADHDETRPDRPARQHPPGPRPRRSAS